jgi:preprotein translocase subunit SecA
MNRHRKATYAMRKEILKADDISKRIRVYIEDEVGALADSSLRLTEEFEPAIRELLPFDEAVLDRVFATTSDKVKPVLVEAAKELYMAREAAFGTEIMRKVERDIYLQILDNLWMQHLENMDHLREGIHWMSVGQRDPLVEYRRRGQMIFEEMQTALRHEVVRAVFYAEPVTEEDLERPIETELTRAARNSISNAGEIIEGEAEFEEADFAEKKGSSKPKSDSAKRKKTNKAERQRKAKARKRK